MSRTALKSLDVACDALATATANITTAARMVGRVEGRIMREDRVEGRELLNSAIKEAETAMQRVTDAVNAMGATVDTITDEMRRKRASNVVPLTRAEHPDHEPAA